MLPVCVSQSILLQQLGVAPFSEGPWPLYIHPQSLSVLSRLLLIWQHKATLQGEPDVPECIKVWERLATYSFYSLIIRKKKILNQVALVIE